MDIKDIISSGLLEMYVLGLTNEQETAEVIALAKQHPEIAAELKAIESGMESYAQANAVQPAASVKDKVLAGINTSNAQTPYMEAVSTGKVTRLSNAWKYAAAASVILFIMSAILNGIYYNKYRVARNDYAQAVAEKDDAVNQLTALEQSNNQMKDNWKIVQSKYSQPVSLDGQPAAPDAAAKIFWMKDSHEVYIDPSNLPEPPAGKQYQFWGFVDGKPVDGGMIITTKKGDKYLIQKMKSFGRAEAFAVTLEDEGGHPQPEGQVYVYGKM